VTKTESRWSGDHKRIVTYVWVEVAEALKGAPGKTVIIQQPGGEVDGIAQRVSGLASFTPGEEVVLFLEQRGGSDRFVVSGLVQGRFRVERSSDKRTLAVPVRAGDAHLIDAHTGQPTASGAKPIELDQLRAQVRAAAKVAPMAQPRKTP
jgi:hypothetical protein